METKVGERREASICVYVAVQNRLLRETLVRLIVKSAGLQVAGASGCPETMAEKLGERRIDVLLADSVETLYGMERIAELDEGMGETRIVLFGMDEDPDCFLKAVRLGVSGYLVKDASSAEITAAVKKAAKGEAVCPPGLCKRLFEYVARDYPGRGAREERVNGAKASLTCRQRQLMALVAEGLTNKEIAAKLHLSEFTVKNHIHRIMKQVEAESRHEAVDAIRAEGLLPSG
jgi:DNA-binding NarL/FixJ family response regulator